MTNNAFNKAFLEALEFYYSDADKFKGYIQDKRLSQQERKILECWLLCRDKKFSEIKEELKKIGPSSHDLVQANINLLTGLAYNNGSEYDLALPYFIEASKMYKKFKLNFHHFISAYNMAIACFNFSNPQDMKQALDEMEQMQLTKENEQKYLLEKAYYFILTQNSKEAFKVLVQIEENISHVKESSEINYIVCRLIYYSSIKDFKACSKELKALKNLRKYNPSANYNFIKVLLEFLVSDKSIYLKESELKDHFFLFNQLKVIQALQQKRFDLALEYWNKMNQRAPHIYQDNFKYNSFKGFFFHALDKALKQSEGGCSIQIDQQASKQDTILSVLKQTDIPISKMDLYKLAWGSTPVKLELKNLQNKINILRKQGYDIQYKCGCYILKKEAKQSA
jgi:hypothetical protein